MAAHESEQIENARIDAVRRYQILDTPTDGSFDRLTALAARACGTPMAIVSIVDEDRIWFKSHYGLDAEQTGRDPGLCASAVLQDGPWIVEDARDDPRTLANPLVAGELGLGFYLGIPLRTSDGHNLGTLCALDYAPRQVSQRQIADMTDLAATVIDILELRLSARTVVALEAEARCRAEQLARDLQESLVPASLPAIECIEIAARYLPANHAQVGGDFYDAVGIERGAVLFIGDVTGHGPEAAALTSMARHSMRTLVDGGSAPAPALAYLNHAIREHQTHKPERRFCTMATMSIEHHDQRSVLTVAIGGHPSPLVLHTDGTVDEVGVPGPMLGWLDNAVYNQVTIDLAPGDTIILYTDGLTDATDTAPNIYDGSLQRLLAEMAGRSAQTIADALLKPLTSVDRNPRDDIAVLVARDRPISGAALA